MTAAQLHLPGPSLRPLIGLLDDVAIIEHARLDRPDPSSGHCVDDAGRALVLACRAPTDPVSCELARRMVTFLAAMHLGDGRFRLRDCGRGAAESDDAAGRAIHGLGVAAGRAPWEAVRDDARAVLAQSGGFDSPHLRACAHAALGALDSGLHPGLDATGLVERVSDRLVGSLDRPGLEDAWPWPEPRLTYGNGLIPEALIAIAFARRDETLLQRALGTLDWLLRVESQPGHFSPTPVGGWAPGEPRPGFDQQPIEAWAIADACKRAIEVTGDGAWGRGIELAAGWFGGSNDAGAIVWDASTGRAYDGLEIGGVNRNQGAESALALVATCLDLDWYRRWLARQPGVRSRRSTR
jgi:hypothetical protein